ncbi:MAG TPA: PQQ-binding-like beta-propeller repeat protein [Conexibacter sp.]|nr:PQQ-binding-like beta-propeller repeat protein [Conexibacter sp.]
MSSPPPRRRLRVLLAAIVVLAVLAGGAVAFVLAHKPGDVSHPDVEFTGSTQQTAPPRPQAVDRFLWPTYGFGADRTRDYADAPGYLRPGFRRGWTYRSGALAEFPPTIDGGSIYFLDDDGILRAIDKVSGAIRWRQHVGDLAAASPAVGDGRVYAVALRGLGSASGRVAAYRASDGRQVWSKALPSRAESSPLLRNGRVFFGSEDGTVYALSARNGRTIWTYRASGAVKGGPALSNGTLYFGDYGGKVHAVSARSGREVWSVGTSGTRFGFGSGSFYSTPAVAFGRVYLGNTDGRVYSFAASSGKLAWATSTGAYVYASAAVGDTPGLGPTVYIGSYDGNFYAFDARSGGVRWKYPAGAKISGSATIVGGLVYFSNLGARNTVGLSARTGRKLWFFPNGGFNPVVADRRAIYLAGYTDIFELLPKRASRSWREAQAATVRAVRQTERPAAPARRRRRGGT